jgi:hypothetical protein
MFPTARAPGNGTFGAGRTLRMQEIARYPVPVITGAGRAPARRKSSRPNRRAW